MIVWQYFVGIRTSELLKIARKVQTEEYLDILQNSALPSLSDKHLLSSGITISKIQPKSNGPQLPGKINTQNAQIWPRYYDPVIWVKGGPAHINDKSIMVCQIQ